MGKLQLLVETAMPNPNYAPSIYYKVIKLSNEEISFFSGCRNMELTNERVWRIRPDSLCPMDSSDS